VLFLLLFVRNYQKHLGIMTRNTLVTIFFAIYMNCYSQTNQDIFEWGKNNFRTSQDSVVSLFNKSKSKDDLYWYAKFDAFIAMIETRKGESYSAYVRYTQSLTFLNKIESDDIKLIYQINRNIAAINMNIGNHGGAVAAYRNALELTEIVTESPEQVDLLKYFLSSSLIEIDSVFAANEILIDLYKNGSDKIKARAANKIGLINQSIGQYAESLKYFDDAIALDKGLEGNPLHNMANSYLKMGKQEVAEVYFYKALDATTKGEGYFVIQLDLGEMYLNQGNNKMAAGVLEYALDTYPQFIDKHKFIKIYDFLSQANRGIDEEKSMVFLNRYRHLRDSNANSLDKTMKSEQLRAVNFRADSERLRAIHTEESTRNTVRTMMLLGIAILACILSVAVSAQCAKNRTAKRKDMILKELQLLD
jgi:tetratricopeptide (TPR) repeat protein